MIARDLHVGQRAEAYLRFPAGPQTLLNYNELRVWVRGRGEGWENGDLEAFIKESKLGAKDLSVLKSRKQIAPEIRALLGEYNDPRINFAKSATKMGDVAVLRRFAHAGTAVTSSSARFCTESSVPQLGRIFWICATTSTTRGFWLRACVTSFS